MLMMDSKVPLGPQDRLGQLELLAQLIKLGLLVLTNRMIRIAARTINPAPLATSDPMQLGTMNQPLLPFSIEPLASMTMAAMPLLGLVELAEQGWLPMSSTNMKLRARQGLVLVPCNQLLNKGHLAYLAQMPMDLALVSRNNMQESNSMDVSLLLQVALEALELQELRPSGTTANCPQVRHRELRTLSSDP